MKFPKAEFQTDQVRLYKGNNLKVLPLLPDQCCHTIITSPPYYQQRDYETATWIGGDPDCAHDAGKMERRTVETYNDDGNYSSVYRDKIKYGKAHLGSVCKKCGAKRIDEQIGSETTIDAFVQTMVKLFREVRRVLRDDGTLWLNLGDSMLSSSKTAEPDDILMEMRDDLTDEEIAYVLHELSCGMNGK